MICTTSTKYILNTTGEPCSLSFLIQQVPFFPSFAFSLPFPSFLSFSLSLFPPLFLCPSFPFSLSIKLLPLFSPFCLYFPFPLHSLFPSFFPFLSLLSFPSLVRSSVPSFSLAPPSLSCLSLPIPPFPFSPLSLSLARPSLFLVFRCLSRRKN